MRSGEVTEPSGGGIKVPGRRNVLSVDGKSPRSILISSRVVKKRLTCQIKGVEVFERTLVSTRVGGTGAMESSERASAASRSFGCIFTAWCCSGILMLGSLTGFSKGAGTRVNIRASAGIKQSFGELTVLWAQFRPGFSL